MALRTLLFLTTIGLLSSLFGQQAAQIIIEKEGDVHPWNHLDVNNDPATFQFAIVTDRTGGLRPGVFPEAVQKLNLLQPEFVMSVGDLIRGYTADTALIDQQWDEFEGFIDQLQMPFFYVPGNHDYINDVMAYKWRERFGKDYYHFVYQEVLFVCLNTEERKRGAGRGYLGEEQLAYLEQTLAENNEAKWTLVFMHQPLWDQEDNGRWSDAEKLLANRKHTVFVGHRHRYVKYERNNGKYFVLATTGGGSSLRGPSFGEFDHVVWVTMTESGPMLANLMLDGIWDEDVNTEGYYRFARPLMDGQNLSLQPLFSNENQFSEGEILLQLQNPSDVPMVAELSFHSNEGLWAVADRWYDTLPPNELVDINLPLQTQKPMSIDRMQAVRIAASYTYLPAQQPQLTVEQSMRIGPERLYQLSEGAKKVKVDGDPKDWVDLPFSLSGNAHLTGSPFAYQGPQDIQARFGVNYGKKAVYFFAEILDDELVLDATQSPYRQDGLYLFLDPRSKEVSALTNGRDREHNLTVGISPAVDGAPQGNVFRPAFLPEGTETICTQTEKGYRVELAIPRTWIEAHAGNQWENVRLNVMLVDYDKEGEQINRLYWRAPWDSPENRVGSGMFEVR